MITITDANKLNILFQQKHLNNVDCQENKKEEYQNCFLCCIITSHHTDEIEVGFQRLLEKYYRNTTLYYLE